MINGPRAQTVNEDAVINSRNQVVQSRGFFTGLQPDIRDALERNGVERVGVAASPRLLLANQVRLVANGLVVHEYSVLHDVK